MSLRLFLLVIGGAFTALGVAGLLFEVSVPVQGMLTGMQCGNGFGMTVRPPVTSGPNWRVVCDEAVSARQLWAWPLLGLGVLVGLIGAFVQTRSERSAAF